MAVEILQERTHKYGRNVTAAAGVILVLTWVPGIKISEFEPLGFDIGPGSGGELSIWCLLTGILVYYFCRFSVSLRIDYLANSHQIRSHYSHLQNYKNQLQQGIEHKNPEQVENAKVNISGIRSDGGQVWQFYILEVGMPFVLFVFAAYAEYVQISSLWN